MTWLITGGCGFVGTNLADALFREGEDVVLLDNLSRVGSRDNLSWLRSQHGEDWLFVEADIRNHSVLARLVEERKPCALAHLAGQVAMTTSIQNPRFDFEVNALGTLNVLESVRQYSPATIVLYSSTNKVYGSLDYLRYQESGTRYILPDYPDGFDENLPLDGHSPYGCSKLAAEQYVRDYHRIYDIPTVVFRHSSIYGGRQFSSIDQGWIGWFCMKSLEMGETDAPAFTICGNGKQVRDVLHADDLVKVYFEAFEQIHRTSGNVYNIGGGQTNSLSLLEFFDTLERLTHNQMRFQKLEWRIGDQKFFIANTGLAAQHFGWKPAVEKEKGLAAMLEWCRELGTRKTVDGSWSPR